jgi:hypothetical protein
MYYVISKSVNTEGKRSILATIASREQARTQARELGGTVKTEAEFNELLATGVMAQAQAATPAETEKPAETPAATPAPAPAAAQATGPDVASVATVVEHAAQVANGAAKVAAEAAALLAPATGKGASIMAMAHSIKSTKPVRRTVGKQEAAEPKRPATDDGVLAAAREHLLSIARPEAKKTKVQIVRDLALWGDKKLQRRDVFALIKSYPGSDLGIADATISTQFQFARSGKERQHG